jgi:hypothetical protein
MSEPRDISPLYLLPASIFGFLAGVVMVSSSRREGSTTQASSRSALPGVSLIVWRRFVGTMARNPRSYESPRGRLGAFGMDPRRLVDVGFSEKPRKVVVGKETGVWTAEFRKPVTKEKYLASLPLQYESFKRSMQTMLPRVSGFVGFEVDGHHCSLSGLLGVGHHAGESGVESWVKDKKIRDKFGKTTEAFRLTNNIF